MSVRRPEYLSKNRLSLQNKIGSVREFLQQADSSWLRTLFTREKEASAVLKYGLDNVWAAAYEASVVPEMLPNGIRAI